MRFSTLTTISIQIFLMFSILQAQEIDFIWGDDIDQETEIVRIVHRNVDGHYTLSNKGKSLFIEYYSNPNYKRKYSTELVLPEISGQKVKFENICYLDGNLVLFTSLYDKSEKTQNTYAYILDEKGNIKSEKYDIFKIKVDSEWRSGNTRIVLSQDKSKMLVFHTFIQKSNVEALILNMKILTSDLIVIKELSENFLLGQVDENFLIGTAIISNNAEVYITVEQFSDLQKLRFYVTKSITIYSYNPSNGFELVKIPVKIFKNKSASSLSLKLDNEGNLLGGGFYGEFVRQGLFEIEAIKGTYFIKVDRLKEEVIINNWLPFDKEFYQQLLSERQLKKGKEILNSYNASRKILLREDGNIVFIAESYSKRIIRKENSRNTTITHGPLIIVNMNPNGEINWVKVVLKEQIYSYTAMGAHPTHSTFSKTVTVFHSFLVGVSDSKLYLIYNDNNKNLSLEAKVPLTGYNKSVPVCITIGNDGTIKKEILNEKGGKGVLLKPRTYHQNTNDEILIFGLKEGIEKFGVITF